MTETRLPTFLVIGAMKAGTTTLWGHLREHPQVFMPDLKEPDFFVAEKNWTQGLEWYQSLFRDAGGALAVGEASPSYTKDPAHPGVPQRVAAALPEVQLVYIMREPISRMRSMFLHNLLRGRETASIDEALLMNPKYLDASRYAHQLCQYLQYFDRDRIHLMLTEDLRDDPATALNALLRFLGLPPDTALGTGPRTDHVTSARRLDRPVTRLLRRIPGASTAVGRAPTPLRQVVRAAGTRGVEGRSTYISSTTRALLLDRLRPDLDQLRAMMGADFRAWDLVTARTAP